MAHSAHLALVLIKEVLAALAAWGYEAQEILGLQSIVVLDHEGGVGKNGDNAFPNPASRWWDPNLIDPALSHRSRRQS
jgi:hypothetical protein